MRHLGSNYLNVLAYRVDEWIGTSESIGKASTNSSGNTYGVHSANFVPSEYVELVSVLVDVVTTDTYTVTVGGVQLGSQPLTGGTTDNAFTPSPRLVLPPFVPALVTLQGTANRAYRFNNGGGPTAGVLGTLDAWLEALYPDHSPGFRVVVLAPATTTPVVL